MSIELLTKAFIAANRIKSPSTQKTVGDNFKRALEREGIDAADIADVTYYSVILHNGEEIEI